MGLSVLQPSGRARAVAVRAVIAPDPVRPWSLPRLAVAAALWGNGFTLPWDPARTESLINQLGVCATDRVLLVGGGPGGIARSLAAATGAEIVCYESDPLLAGMGATLAYRPGQPDFGRRGFDHAVVIEGWAGGRLEDLLAAVAFALRPGGRVAVESVLGDPVAACRVLSHLRCNLDVAEDHSAGFIARATGCWAALAAKLERAGGEAMLPPSGRKELRAEAQDWMLRLQSLRSGALRRVRLVAQGRGIGYRMTA